MPTRTGNPPKRGPGRPRKDGERFDKRMPGTLSARQLEKLRRVAKSRGLTPAQQLRLLIDNL